MKAIYDPVGMARQATNDYKNRYGNDLISVVLYGSAAGGDFDPRRSDINLLVILTTLSHSMLEKSQDIQNQCMKKRFSRPLFMDKEYITHSLDSFPIEFLTMKERYTVLYGEDVLKNIRIDNHELSIQVERELKGKWLHLLHEWPKAKKHPKLLSRLLQVSMGDFSAVFHALLYLKGVDVPKERKALFAAVTGAFGLDDNALEHALEALRNKDKNAMVAVFPAYSQAIKKLITTVDELSSKEDT